MAMKVNVVPVTFHWTDHPGLHIQSNGTSSLVRPVRMAKHKMRIALGEEADLKGGTLTIKRVDTFGRKTPFWSPTSAGERFRDDAAWARLEFVMVGGLLPIDFTIQVECWDDADELAMDYEGVP